MNRISLYLVATPIGNRADLSPRAVEVLGHVDFVAAEDTRTSGLLLSYYGIKKPMVSYFEHNRWEKGPQILERLRAGQTCALVTDAGMPAISDPGQDLVALCHDAGLGVSAIPGPCAFVTALAMSGLPSRRFCFEGFLESASAARRRQLEELAREQRTLIFYEAPHRLGRTLADLVAAFGQNRQICVVREISKIYEEARRMDLGQALEFYGKTAPRGEFVLVVEGACAPEPPLLSGEELLQAAAARMAEGKPKSVVAKELAREYGLGRNEIYSRIKDL